MTDHNGSADLVISTVSKRFIDSHETVVDALSEVSLEIPSGEFIVLLGPSGCGKTTLLRSIAGFEDIDSGSIRLGGVELKNLAPNKRPVNTVFQNYALFPHMSVEQNIAFGLESEKLPKEVITKRVKEILELVELSELAKRKPAQMSGGQQQRAALARALAKKPKVLLLDEPLAALDLKLRRTMQSELKRIHTATGTTFLFVTHDQNEAMALGDRIAVFSKGKLQQVGTPIDIYTNPVNQFVANFIGESSTFNGEIISGVFEGSGLRIPGLGLASSKNSQILIRPEDLTIDGSGSSCGAVTIIEAIYSGDFIDVVARTSTDVLISIKGPIENISQLVPGAILNVGVNVSNVRVFS